MAVIGRQVPEAMEVLLAETVRADAAVAREDSEFAVLGRQVAVGGQLLELQGLGGVYSEIFLPLHGEHQAHNAVDRAGRRRGVLRRRRRSVNSTSTRSAPVSPPPPAPADWNGCAARQRFSSTPPTTRPVRRRWPQTLADEFDFRFLVGVVVGDGRQGRRRHPGRAGAGVRPDRRDPQRLAARARRRDAWRLRAEERFGPERVVAAATLPDAIETATALVEEAGA